MGVKGTDNQDTASKAFTIALAILREGINEVIATTRNNAAPIGVIRRGNNLHMAVYLESHTAKNLQTEPWTVLHITDNPIWFVKTAFSDPDLDEYVSETMENGMTIQRLANFPSWIGCTHTIEKITTHQILVSLTPVQVTQTTQTLYPVNRGYNSIIEATVHATRYIGTKDPWLHDLISFHLYVAKKCGDDVVKEAAILLSSYLEEYECPVKAF